MRLALVITICLITQVASGQDFTPEQTKEDLQFLVRSLEAYNPALYEYNPSFKDNVAKVTQEITNNVDKFGYFQLVSRVAALSNEGHIGVGNWEDTFHNGFLNNTYKYLPLAVSVVDGRVYAWADLTVEEAIQKGDEILSINGRPTDELVADMMTYLSTDGHIKSSAYYKLTAGFNWMYYLYIEQPEKFELSYKIRETGTIAEITMPAITRQQMVDNLKDKNTTKKAPMAPSGAEEVYEFEIEDGVGFLTLKSFNRQLIERHKIKAKKLYKEVFEKLNESNVENLVIDLRNNNGGRYEFGFEILPFIMKEERSGWFKTSISWEGKVKEYKLPRQDKANFMGDIWVLVNGGTFSTSSSLARYLKEYAGATIVGEEGAGRYEGFVAGSQQYVHLPNSKLRVAIPRYHNKFPESSVQKTTNRGVLPDQEVVYTVNDLIEERDMAMEKVRKLIAESN
ncbi:MAG: S41 family peptidase [Fulvivirga sp.]